MPGKALGDDLRRLIIDKCLAAGGNRLTGELPVSLKSIANELCVCENTVMRIWRKFCTENVETPRKRGGDFSSKLTDGDLELIETLKCTKGSMSLRELFEIVEEFSDTAGNISVCAISRAVRNRLPSGHRYTRKRINHVALERFTENSMLYTQLFINYLYSKDPRKLKFFDESGVKTPDVGTRRYGHAPVGKRCVEVVKKMESANITLNLLVSLNGVEYHNIIDGATNTATFLNFFFEASEATSPLTGRPAIEVGDTIVLDNLAVHHYDGGAILEDYLEQMGVELVYTPVYSPDLNPVEMCFGKIKSKLNGELINNVHNNIKIATMDAVETISATDMIGYYKATSYLLP